MSKQIVFVDPTVQDKHVLLQGIEPAIEVVHLIREQDGLRQIADHMTKCREIDAIHIISHGASGMLQLGSASINRTNLKDYFIELAHVGRAMREGGDILLYGCEVAAGEPGAALIEGIAKLTGANVAASTLPVGHSNLGGTWDLDFQAGHVNTVIPFDQKARSEFRQVLPVEPDHLVNTSTTGLQWREQIVTLSTGAYAIVWDSDPTSTFAETSAYFQLYDFSGTAIGTETQIGSTTFSFYSEPKTFALANGNFLVGYGGQVTIFDSNGTTVGTASLDATNPSLRFVRTENNGFGAVYSVPENGTGPEQDIVVQFFDATGALVAGPATINQTISGDQVEPSIAAIPNTSEFLVAWKTNEANSSNFVFAQRVNSTGQPLGDEITVALTTAFDSIGHVHVTALNDGKMFITYIFEDNNTLTGAIYGSDGTFINGFGFFDPKNGDYPVAQCIN